MTEPQVYVALVRAINLAGRNSVGMAELRRMVERAGLRNVRTLLQSGNVIFESDARPPAELERALEEGAASRLGVETEFFVRTSAQWAALVAANPYPAHAERDPGHLVLMCLKTAPSRARVAALRRAIAGRETVRVRGREAYLTYPDGIGRSRLTTAAIERHLGTRVTGRNWNTVLRLAAVADSLKRK